MSQQSGSPANTFSPGQSTAFPAFLVVVAQRARSGWFLVQTGGWSFGERAAASADFARCLGTAAGLFAHPVPVLKADFGGDNYSSATFMGPPARRDQNRTTLPPQTRDHLLSGLRTRCRVQTSKTTKPPHV